MWGGNRGEGGGGGKREGGKEGVRKRGLFLKYEEVIPSSLLMRFSKRSTVSLRVNSVLQRILYCGASSCCCGGSSSSWP